MNGNHGSSPELRHIGEKLLEINHAITIDVTGFHNLLDDFGTEA